MTARPPDLASLTAELIRFKVETEARWAVAELDPAVYGFQLQRGTRWNPGLGVDEIRACERALGVRFPESLRCMLSVMNGTDLPTLNLYGSCGLPPGEWVGVYAYPRDLRIVHERMALVRGDREEIARELAQQGFDLPREAALVPICSHRFLVCVADRRDGPVLSIHGTDAVVYGPDLLTCLRRDFLEDA